MQEAGRWGAKWEFSIDHGILDTARCAESLLQAMTPSKVKETWPDVRESLISKGFSSPPTAILSLKPPVKIDPDGVHG